MPFLQFLKNLHFSIPNFFYSLGLHGEMEGERKKTKGKYFFTSSLDTIANHLLVTLSSVTDNAPAP